MKSGIPWDPSGTPGEIDGRQDAMQITTDKHAEHATSGGAKRLDIPVSGAKGLVLRVTAGGHKSWALRYYVSVGTRTVTDTSGNTRQATAWERRRITLGQYPSTSLKIARERANKVRREVEIGDDPAVQKQADRQSSTFNDLFDYWYQRHAVRKLDAHEDERRRYEIHLRDRIGKVQAVKLTRQHASRVRDEVADSAGPVQSNRVIALVNRVLNFAVDEELIEVNVAARLRKAGVEKPRERVLTDDEIARLWAELDRCEHWEAEPGTGGRGRPMSLPIVRAVRLMLLLGQRRTEVIGAATGELALGEGLLLALLVGLPEEAHLAGEVQARNRHRAGGL